MSSSASSAAAQRPALAAQTEAAAGATRVLLSGDINEFCDFAQLAAELPAGALVLDLAGIRRISSAGVREWVSFLERLCAGDRKVSFERCSVPVVAQFNMVEGFRGTGEIVSIFAPYYCGECNADQLKLIDVHGDVTAQLEVPVHCPLCAQQMEFDDLPENYFMFRAARAQG